MRHMHCTNVKPGRCRQDGRRILTHTCKWFPGHTARHTCTCGHTWPNTPYLNLGARRRNRNEES